MLDLRYTRAEDGKEAYESNTTGNHGSESRNTVHGSSASESLHGWSVC
jgi:hypothetical protein